MSLILIVAALFIAGANAECSNACNGHGHCTNFAAEFSSTPQQRIQLRQPTSTVSGSEYWGYDVTNSKKDSCTCFTHLGHNGKEVFQYTGPDCSINTCPHGPAHAGETLSLAQVVISNYEKTSNVGTGATERTGASTANGGYHTQYVECSGQGVCESGVCKCYPGYEGDACQRTSCPNMCSSAGRCLTQRQIVEDVKDAGDSFFGDYFDALTYDDAFDAETTFGCVCDKGRSGPDCSIIDCPSGADVMEGPGALEGRTCSGRGTCDTTSGQCNCYEGFFGTRCESQRSKAM